MPEPIEPEPRVGKSAREELVELKRVQVALLKAIKEAEELLDEPLMPTGEYHGIAFKD